MKLLLFMLFLSYQAQASSVLCEYKDNRFVLDVESEINIKNDIVVRNNIGHVFIKNINSLSELNDYVEFENKLKRKVIFSLKCKKI